MNPQMKQIFELDKNFKINVFNMLKEIDNKMGNFSRDR